MPGRTSITSVPRVAVDLETTGLHPEQDAIIEIGAVKFAGEQVLDTFESFVSPTLPIPYRVQRLTGITTSQLKGAPSLGEMLPRLRAFLGDLPLVGHSVPFDAAFLRRAGLARHNPLVDTFELASALLPGLPSYTLGAVGKALGVKSPTYHRALADAQLSMDVFLALLQRLEQLDASTIEGLGRIAAPPDWTPAYFVRNAVREQRMSFSNSANTGGLFAGMASSPLGDQLAAQLGMDPAVLSLAIKPENPPARMRLIPSQIGQSPGSTVQDAPNLEIEAIQPLSQIATTAVEAPAVVPVASPPQVALEAQVEAQTQLAETISTHVHEALANGVSPLLIEVQNDSSGVVTCLATALTWTNKHGGKLLVSVADHDGLSRLAQRLLPQAFVAAALPENALSVTELVERNAYLCLHRWFGAARLPHDGILTQEMARGLAKLTVWAGQTETGARGEVALAGPELAAWERVRAGMDFSDSIAGCTYRRDGYCFIARAQQAATQAQVVLTTHAALAAYLDGKDDLLSAADQVVVLDAHLLGAELRQARSSALEYEVLLEHLNELAEVGAEGRRSGLLHLAAQRLETSVKGGASREKAWFAQVEHVRHSATTCFKVLRQLLSEAQGENAKNGKGGQQSESMEQRMLPLDSESQQLASWQEVAQAWNTLDGQLGAIAKLAREVGQQLVALRGKKASVASDGIATDLFGSARLLDGIRSQCTAVLSNEEKRDTANIIHWLRLPYPNTNTAGEPGQGRPWRFGQQHQFPTRTHPHGAQGKQPAQAQPETQVTPPVDTATVMEQPGDTTSLAIQPADEASELPVLHSAPVQVGQSLETLYANNRSLILAAPALAVAGDFNYTLSSLSLPATTPTLGPAMDRSQQTLLCLPTDVPEPNAPQYQRHLDDLLIRLATSLNGDLVVVFPSHAALRTSANNVRRTLERQRIMLLAQGQDGSVRQLWQAFRSETRVVLLGAGAFWDGAEQLERPPACVLMTRVPFPALSDPLLAARADLYDDQQSQFVVPHAALKLRQALGGLAWSHWRRNSVVLFDRRLQTRGYGPTILGTLPRCTQYQESVEQIVERTEEWVK